MHSHQMIEAAVPPTGTGSSETPIVRVSNLSVEYWKQDQRTLAVESLSFQVTTGRTLAIVGESGSGKTAICRAVIGMMPRVASLSGDIVIAGKSMVGASDDEWKRIRGRVVAMVLQDPSRSLNPTKRVGEQISEAVTLHLGFRGREARREAEMLMDMLMIDAAISRYSSYPHQLSGGMKQRIAIAVAIAGRPQLLLADESVRSLDPIAKATTLKLLKDIQRDRGMAMVLVSHNLNGLRAIADEIMVMYGGRAVERAAAKALLSRPRMPYTRDLLSATPGCEMTRQTLLSSSMGKSDIAIRTDQGCKYVQRCLEATDLCKSVKPVMQDIAANHEVACLNPLGSRACG
jgi:oligopeptide/dipeptide ABC transporter ATP-binding protein